MTEIDAAERVQQFVNAFAEENPRAETVDPAVNMMTASSDLPDLTVADLRAVLRELRHLRAREVDPSTTYLVTVKLPKNPAHNPRAKQTGPCPFSDECTDVTGEHHTFLTNAAGLAELRTGDTHVTRVELLQKTPDFLRELEVQVQGRPPRKWASAEEIPVAVEQVKDGFGRTWTRQFLPLADGAPQWRLADDRFGRPLPANGFPVTEVD
jgi:hypothetical protein